jgi:hypothetical protein
LPPVVACYNELGLISCQFEADFFWFGRPLSHIGRSSNQHEEGQNMKPITTGPGISGIFADELAALVFDLRTQSNDPRWRLYIEAVPGHGYSLRIYGPDVHSEVYAVRKNINALETIRQILVTEWNLWQSRVRAAAALTTG